MMADSRFRERRGYPGSDALGGIGVMLAGDIGNAPSILHSLGHCTYIRKPSVIACA